MTRSDSRQEDDNRRKERLDAVTKAHGGDLVEAIAPEELVSFNDADCKHDRLIRDETETEFNAFVCTNPKCNEVVLFLKN